MEEGIKRGGFFTKSGEKRGGFCGAWWGRKSACVNKSVEFLVEMHKLITFYTDKVSVMT